MFSPRSKWRIRWDFIIMLIATWNAFTLPLEISFEPPSLVDSTFYKVLSWLIDFCFLVDIVVVFRTLVTSDEDGSLVSEKGFIAMKSLKGDFCIDLLSTIPFDSVVQLFTEAETARSFKVFGILKLVRLLRLNRIITNMNVLRDTKTALKLGKLIFFLIMYVHCTSCLWYFTVKGDGLWMPPLDYIWGWQEQIFFNETL
jgi:hypothetical protein